MMKMDARALHAYKQRRKHGHLSPVDFILQVAAPEDRKRHITKLKSQITGLDLDQLNPLGFTALNQNVLDGNLQNVKILVELGVDIDKKDFFGWSALHYAASLGYMGIVRYLLRHGANVRTTNNFEQFPVEVTDDDEIRRLLLRATIFHNLPPLDAHEILHSF